jgi:metal-sulfur cluster biosynthetic enzyme
VTAAEVRAALDEIVDPCSVVAGAPAGLAEMGLVREVSVGESPAGAVVRVRIGLTEPGCMMGASFVVKARERLAALPGVARVDVELDHAADWHPSDADPAYQERLRSVRAERRAALERGVA